MVGASEAVQALLTDLVADPQRVRDMLPNYVENDVILFEDDSISIWHCRFMPGFAVPAHDHQTHATIAVYDGAERNDFFEKGADGSLSKTREVVLEAGGVLEIGPDDIHSVACASETPCCGNPLRAFATTSYGKLYEGTRLIAVPNGKNAKDWAIRRRESNPAMVRV